MAKGHLNFLAFSNAHRICKYGGGYLLLPCARAAAATQQMFCKTIDLRPTPWHRRTLCKPAYR